MSRLINKFQYSHSRFRTFSECERKYYLSAYEMWDGWDRNAPPEKKLAYRLTKVASLPAWAGTIVHETITRTLAGSVSLDYPADLKTIQEYALNSMRRGWRQALEKRYEIRPKGNANIFELYYGLETPIETTQILKDKVLICLENFVGSHLSKLSGIPRQDRLETDQFTSFTINGLRVALAIDFAYRKDGQVHILDWKTGRRRDEHVEQVRVYALYAQSKWGVKAEDIFLHLCYLEEGSEQVVHVTESDLRATQATIKERAGLLESKLRGCFAASNSPLPMEDFAMTEDRWKCDRCKFYEACYGTRIMKANTKETA